jgi:hypothetical protein
MPNITVLDSTMFYREAGSGPAIVEILRAPGLGEHLTYAIEPPTGDPL